MNVGELIEFLGEFPKDMEIITTCCSDYDLVTKEDFGVVKAVCQDYYYMRSHPTMSAENKSKEMSYLHISGN